MSDKTGQRKPRGNVIQRFILGMILTLALVVLIPIITEKIIQPWVVDQACSVHFEWISSSMIITLVMWGFILLSMLLVGGGAVFRYFGTVGVLGLVAAYYLLGSVENAIVPVLSIMAACIISSEWQKHKDKKAE